MKRVFVAILAGLVMVSATACGSRNDIKKLAGTWTFDVDVTERMNTATEQALGFSAESSTGKLQVRMVFTVSEDGTFSLGYDEDAVRDAMDSYVEALHLTAIEDIYAAAEKQGFSREEYDEAMKEANISMDTLVEGIFASVDEEELVRLLTGRGAVASGYCTAKDGKLYLADSAEELAEAGYITYAFNSDGTMSWTDEDGTLSGALTAEEQEVIRFPMVWTKQAA